MSIKSFNVDEDTYGKFSSYCKENGISMSKQVETFMKSMIEEDPQVKQEYLEKLERIRKGKFVKVNNFAERYGLKE
ncbi:hypothetical protein C0585_06775 [Candidatus Woesearchaeota archaeon]|nr:MAG: hypothetical protein C0585_06775 [Candidatus Woesearchaeota archaeon]